MGSVERSLSERGLNNRIGVISFYRCFNSNIMLPTLVRHIARAQSRVGVRWMGSYGEVDPKLQGLPTMNELPVAEGSWEEHHRERQKKHNMRLVGGISFFLLTVLAGTAAGTFNFSTYRPDYKSFKYDEVKYGEREEE